MNKKVKSEGIEKDRNVNKKWYVVCYCWFKYLKTYIQDFLCITFTQKDYPNKQNDNLKMNKKKKRNEENCNDNNNNKIPKTTTIIIIIKK